jgi:uncharacterized membrane protein YidH (DUF202 family)
MDSLSIIILVLGVGMAAVGVMEVTRSQSRKRAGREQDRRGMMLFAIGVILCLLVGITKLAQ